MPDFDWRPCTDDTAEHVLRDRFGTRPAALHRLIRTSVNTVWRVDTPDGPLVLKRLGRHPEPAWLRFQHHAITRAAEHGLPVHPLIRTPDGGTSVFAAGACWQLRGYADGRLYRDGDPADLARAAVCLDTLHGLPLAGLPAAGNNPVHDVEFWLDADPAALDELTRTITTLVPPALSERVVPPLRAAYHRARAELDPARYDALPKALTHGEFAGSNLVFAADGTVRAILDWDGVDIRPRAYDLARASLFLARTARGSFVVHPELAAALLVDATRHRPVEPAELAAIVPILEMYCLPTPHYLAQFAERSPNRLDWFLRWSAEGADTVRTGMAEAVTRAAG